MATESEANREKKAASIERIYELLGTHKQILLANFTNVESNQVQLIRKQLRSYDGLLVISKNVTIHNYSDPYQEDPHHESRRN
jgi:ribosomal protein L10